MKLSRFLLSLLMLLALLSCASYRSQEVPFRPPDAQSSRQVVGATLSATAYADKEAAGAVFGFDIRDAGVLPVQLVVDNGGEKQLRVVEDQTFLIDAQGNYWKLLEGSKAYARIEESSEYGRLMKKSGRGGMLGAGAGALAGAALGILTGENVGTATLKGAAVGGAGGAIVGGGQDMGSGDSASEIASDLRSKGLHGKTFDPGSLMSGFLFFPGEAQSASFLRLQLKEAGTGTIHNLTLPF